MRNRRSEGQLVGRLGEEAASRELYRRGYRILSRNWDGGRRRYELDLVTEKDGVIVFVEVKTRTPAAWRDPADAVDHTKRLHLRRAARRYMARYRDCAPHRFDVVSVFLDADHRLLRIRIDENAFSPDGDHGGDSRSRWTHPRPAGHCDGESNE